MYLESFSIIGISVRTTNQNGQAAQDIPKLWERFFAENILEKIPYKVDVTIYSVYSDYAGDYTQPYTTYIGCKVVDLSHIPPGLVAKTIPAGNFEKFSAKGNLHQGAVFAEWQKIWQAPLQRKYSADFEVYGPKALDPHNAEVDIFIAVQ